MSGLARAELTAALRSLGLARGDRVLVHSSLRRVGKVEDDAEGLVDALLDAIGPQGLLVAPTFTYDTPRFDPATTPGRTGAVGEALRRRPGAVRSLHPFYSVAAIGADVDALCAGHELLPGTAAGTPLDRLAAGGGLVLLLGVGHVADTTVHVGEFRADAPYLDIPFDASWPAQAVVVAADAELHVSYDRFAGCSRAFGAVELPLRRRGAVRDGRVGAALAQLVEGRAIVEETVALLEADPAALLCTDGGCHRCSRARARLRA